ncbi:hypothetical protein COLO4_01706 [Corchorus olitorius]|uniref:Uncharacterized protein n=1 Tax=Corchorus olitorius TaxID=93759 RepID=A0A1R3L2B9_9ROSI|nr:hypothetical protein COLO4_03245 [Corchorus olitorius]OMP13429.1 hypothetical protein COLO4_01706 [Corchorus olitorius]
MLLFYDVAFQKDSLISHSHRKASALSLGIGSFLNDEFALRRVLLKLLSTYVILSLSLISQFPTVKPSGAPSPTRLALTTKERTRLQRSFLHFDHPCMRSLKVFLPEPFFIRNGFRLDLKGASYIYWTRRKYKLSCSMHGFDVFFCLNSTRSLPA